MYVLDIQKVLQRTVQNECKVVVLCSVTVCFCWRFPEIARKGTVFCAYSQKKCTKLTGLCTFWSICAISVNTNKRPVVTALLFIRFATGVSSSNIRISTEILQSR